MQPTQPARDPDQRRRAETTEYVVAEWLATEFVVGEPPPQEDGMDWHAFWAEYAANIE